MARNNSAAGDSRFSRTGKDAAIYDEDGTLLASIETFKSNVSIKNSNYNVLGDPQEHEAAGMYNVNITCTEIVIEDNKFIVDVFNYMHTGELPRWNMQGSLLAYEGGSEERVLYRDCIPSGDIDLQNFSVGDTVKRDWKLFVNKPPRLQSLMTKTA